MLCLLQRVAAREEAREAVAVSIARINPDLVDAFCSACKREVMVGPALTCPECGEQVEPTSLAVMPKRVPVDAPKPQQQRVAVLPRIRDTEALSGALDAALTALETEERAAQTAYEAAKERYRLARQALADARQLRGLVKVAEGPASTDRPKRAANASLPAGRWSRKFDACIKCGRTEVRHVANGRCASCDKRWREAGKPS